MIDAIVWKFQTGSEWVHLPKTYGNWRGVYNRLRMWALDGTWERLFTALMIQADAPTPQTHHGLRLTISMRPAIGTL